MRRTFALVLPLLALAGCKPPAADDYVARVALDGAQAHVGEPIASPDTKGAVWAPSERPTRILYGKPGAVPLFALACETTRGGHRIHVTRFVAADPKAEGVLALVGNGHAVRLPVDATWNGHAWLWEGYAPAEDPDLEVLTGRRMVEATIPGAGTVDLNPSPLPREVIDACSGAAPQPSPSASPA